MKSAFDEIIKRLDTVEERILKIWKEQQQKTKTEKRNTTQNRISKDCGAITKCIQNITNILGEIEKGTEEIFDTMSENFPNLILDTKPLIQ